MLPWEVLFFLGKIRRGGYIFFIWKGDHAPRHVHVMRGRRLIVKWNLTQQQAAKGEASARIRHLIRELEAEGRL